MCGAVGRLQDAKRLLLVLPGGGQVAEVLQDDAEVGKRDGHLGVAAARRRLFDPKRLRQHLGDGAQLGPGPQVDPGPVEEPAQLGGLGDVVGERQDQR